jgi:hypothetical protein
MVENGATVALDFQMLPPSHSTSKRRVKRPESPLKKIGHTLKHVFSPKPQPTRK